MNKIFEIVRIPLALAVTVKLRKVLDNFYITSAIEHGHIPPGIDQTQQPAAPAASQTDATAPKS